MGLVRGCRCVHDMMHVSMPLRPTGDHPAPLPLSSLSTFLQLTPQTNQYTHTQPSELTKPENKVEVPLTEIQTAKA